MTSTNHENVSSMYIACAVTAALLLPCANVNVTDALV